MNAGPPCDPNVTGPVEKPDELTNLQAGTVDNPFQQSPRLPPFIRVGAYGSVTRGLPAHR